MPRRNRLQKHHTNRLSPQASRPLRGESGRERDHSRRAARLVGSDPLRFRMRYPGCLADSWRLAPPSRPERVPTSREVFTRRTLPLRTKKRPASSRQRTSLRVRLTHVGARSQPRSSSRSCGLVPVGRGKHRLSLHQRTLHLALFFHGYAWTDSKPLVGLANRLPSASSCAGHLLLPSKPSPTNWNTTLPTWRSTPQAA